MISPDGIIGHFTQLWSGPKNLGRFESLGEFPLNCRRQSDGARVSPIGMVARLNGLMDANSKRFSWLKSQLIGDQFYLYWGEGDRSLTFCESFQAKEEEAAERDAYQYSPVAKSSLHS